jgi:hypothetical protein
MRGGLGTVRKSMKMSLIDLSHSDYSHFGTLVLLDVGLGTTLYSLEFQFGTCTEDTLDGTCDDRPQELISTHHSMAAHIGLAVRDAIEQEDLFTVAGLLDGGYNPTPYDFEEAVQQKSFAILEMFLNAGYDINTCARSDRPPALA